jgi:hypothetical protein
MLPNIMGLRKMKNRKGHINHHNKDRQMHINQAMDHSTVYYVQVQHGAISFKGTWFSEYQDYDQAYQQFLKIIQKHKSIAIKTDQEVGLYIHIGPGMILLFMSVQMNQHAEQRAKEQQEKAETQARLVQSGIVVPRQRG